MGLGDVLKGGGTSGSSIQVGDVGTDPAHGKGPGKFPAQGRQANYREAVEATVGWELGVTTVGFSDGESGFEEMGAYVLKRQNTVAQYIATRLFMEFCKETVRRPGAWVASRCC